MAEIGIIETFHATHGSKPHEHNFKIEVVLEGKIDEKTGYVSGIDYREVVSELKKIISKLENKNLKLILSDEGFKSSGVESIATYFIRLLKNKFPVKYARVYETENRYATVYSSEA